MDIDKLFYQFSITTDEVEANELLFLLVYYFMELYDGEKERFIKDSDLDIHVESYEQVKEDYALYLADVFIGARERVQLKEQELIKSDEEDASAKLYTFIDSNFERINNTETVNVKQIAQLQVVAYVQDQDKAAKIYKQWVAHSGACDICKALDGTKIPVDEPFLVNGQVIELSDGGEFIYDYIDRDVAIAHPNDQCGIEFIIEY